MNHIQGMLHRFSYVLVYVLFRRVSLFILIKDKNYISYKLFTSKRYVYHVGDNKFAKLNN